MYSNIVNDQTGAIDKTLLMIAAHAQAKADMARLAKSPLMAGFRYADYFREALRSKWENARIWSRSITHVAPPRADLHPDLQRYLSNVRGVAAEA